MTVSDPITRAEDVLARRLRKIARNLMAFGGLAVSSLRGSAVTIHDHHNDPNDPINRSKRLARIEHPKNDSRAVTLDKRMGAWLIGLLALIMFGGLIVTLFDMATGPTDPIATATNSGSSGSRTTTGVGHGSR